MTHFPAYKLGRLAKNATSTTTRAPQNSAYALRQQNIKCKPDNKITFKDFRKEEKVAKKKQAWGEPNACIRNEYTKINRDFVVGSDYLSSGIPHSHAH